MRLEIGPWAATKQLGHRSMSTTEKHYLGSIKVPEGCRSLEAAMGIE